MNEIRLSNISIDKLSIPLLIDKGVEVDVLRLDKIHPDINGNKWFKLRYYLEDAKLQHKKTIVTYGGAWSNHIIATAAACKISGIKSIGIIRGEETANLSPTLINAKEMGMQLFFTTRDEYKHGKVPAQLNQNGNYFIPEGGYGIKGAEGASTILNYCEKESYSHICCAAGTGTMAAGLIKGSVSFNRIIAISVLKNNFDLEEAVTSLTGKEANKFRIIHDYHFGGYAKHNPELLYFMNDFYRQTNIPTDFVYTGKLFFAVNDLMNKNFFTPGSKVLIIHSGGLQGNASFSNGTLIF